MMTSEATLTSTTSTTTHQHIIISAESNQKNVLHVVAEGVFYSNLRCIPILVITIGWILVVHWMYFSNHRWRRHDAGGKSILPGGPTTYFEHLRYLWKLQRYFLPTLYELKERYGNIVQLFGGSLVFVMDPSTISQILVSNVIFEKGPDYTEKFAIMFGEGLVTTTNIQLHRKFRSLLGKFFSIRTIIDQHVHWMSQLTVDTFQEIYPQPQHSSSSFVVDMQQLAHLISFRIICKYICGVDILTVTTKEYEKQAIKDVCFGNTVLAHRILFQLPMLPLLDPQIIYMKRRLHVWHSVLDQICRRSCGSGGERNDCCLQALIDAGCTSKEIHDQITTLIVAGFETTANLIAFTSYRIAKFPHVQSKLRHELDRIVGLNNPTIQPFHIPQLHYLQQVLKESMRLNSIIPVLTRTCTSSTCIPAKPAAASTTNRTNNCNKNSNTDTTTQANILLPKGCRLILPLIALHRDTDLWDEANLFIPERFEDMTLIKKQFFPFGYGTRSCIGSILSITEAVVVLASLLQRYIFHLEDDQKKPKISGFGISLSSSNGIFISFRPIASSGDVDDEIKE